MEGEDGRAARGARTRRRLLHAARQLIEERGTATIGMEEVADAAGVSRRTVYDHFGSRAGLFLAMAIRADEDADLGERLVPVLTAPTAGDAIDRLVELVADVTPRMLDLAIAIDRARVDDPDAGATWDDRMASRMEVFRQLARRLAADGVLREELSVEEAADTIHAVLAWQSWRLLVVERGWTPDQWATRTKDLLKRTLTAG